MATASFQKSIKNFPANGVPGDKATLNPAVYTVGTPLAETAVNVASFVWPSTTPGFAKQSGTGVPLGFVGRVQAYYNYDLKDGGTLTVPIGSELTVARRGDFYAVALTAATVGQKVFAVLADGTLKTGAAGATISGAVETPWTVTDLAGDNGAVGTLITISNWS